MEKGQINLVFFAKPKSFWVTHNLLHPYGSHSAHDWKIILIGRLEEQSTCLSFFFFFFTAKWRNLSISGHFQTPLEGRRRRESRGERKRRQRTTSVCNVLPQHSFSDVVWHLVHKAIRIHTLPSYISGKGVSGECVKGKDRDREWVTEEKEEGALKGRERRRKGRASLFVFTHTRPLPETLDHISDSFLSSLLTQSHVKDWWEGWWTKINQSRSHSYRQTAMEAGEQTGRPSSVSRTRHRCSLAKIPTPPPQLFFHSPFLLNGHSVAAYCPLLSIWWLYWMDLTLGDRETHKHMDTTEI